MPDPRHPRMLEDGSFAPLGADTPQAFLRAVVPGETTAPSTEPETPVEEVATPGEAQASPEPAPEIPAAPSFTLDELRDGRNLRRLMEQYPELSNTVLTIAGRKVSKDAQAQIETLRAELAEREERIRRSEIERMTATEIDERFEKDPEFARQYTNIIHPENRPSPEQVAEQAYFESRKAELYDSASLDIPEDRLRVFEHGFSHCYFHNTDDHGTYDHDDQGRFYLNTYRDVSAARKASFDRFQDLLQRERPQWRARQQQPPPPPPSPVAQQQAAPAEAPASTNAQAPAAVPAQPTAQVVGQLNTNLAQVSPDLTAGNRAPTSGRRRWTYEEYRNMTPPQRLALFPNPGDYENAIKSGELYVPGLSEEIGIA